MRVPAGEAGALYHIRRSQREALGISGTISRTAQWTALMARRGNSWLVDRLQKAIANGFSKAYVRVQVDPNAYLNHVRRAYRLPIQSFDEMFYLPQETVDNLADQTISGAMKFAALEGTGFGLGGLITVIPDMGIHAAIAVRMLQKLSLL